MLLSFRKALLVFGLLGAGALASLPLSAADQPTPAQIQKLIDQLGSGEFEEREEATKKLGEIGVPAYDLLKKATASSDAEIKQRAEDLVSKLARQVESVAILAPKKVHLVYNDTPISEAVKDFATKSGYPIRLLDPQNKLKDRKITLDTGEVTFWEALDKFTEKADLSEAAPNALGQPQFAPGNIAVPVPLPPVIRPINRRPIVQPPVPPDVRINPPPVQKELPPRPPEQPLEKKDALQEVAFQVEAQAQVQGEGKILVKPAIPVQAQPVVPAVVQVQANGNVVIINQQAIQANGGMPGVNPPARGITLVDGKKAAVPTDGRSAIRIRTSDHIKNLGKPDTNEIRIGLELATEPKLTLQGIQAVRIDKALDDQDQTLSQRAQAAEADAAVPGIPPNAPGGFARPAIAIARFPGVPGFGGGMEAGNPFTHFSLTAGPKPAKSLKEVTGVVTAQVIKPAEALITVDDILKAKGKEFKGKTGGLIKVSDVNQDANGNTTVQFEFVPPPNAAGANGGGIGLPNINIQIAPLPVPPPLPPQGFAQQIQIQQVQPAQIALPPVQLRAINPAFRGMPGNNEGFTLVDEKGGVINPIGMGQSMRQDGQGIKIEQRFTYPKTENKPAKLTYSVQQSVTIDVPFTLKNVQIP